MEKDDDIKPLEAKLTVVPKSPRWGAQCEITVEIKSGEVILAAQKTMQWHVLVTDGFVDYAMKELRAVLNNVLDDEHQTIAGYKRIHSERG